MIDGVRVAVKFVEALANLGLVTREVCDLANLSAVRFLTEICESCSHQP